MIKTCKIILVAIVATFFTLVAFNNITDYGTNFLFVKHVLSMDSIFATSDTTWRAIKSTTLDQTFYILIILWECLTALVCWLGTVHLALTRKEEFTMVNKTTAFVGLTMGFVLYAFGFLVIGGEGFQMWQSKIWNGQQTAGIFINFIGLVMIILLLRDE